MKITDARIGMTVKTYCNTYTIEGIRRSGIDVKLVETGECFSNTPIEWYTPVKQESVKPVVKDSIVSRFEKLAARGTSIVSFTYDGVRRNVILGSKDASGHLTWGKKLNSFLTSHNGNFYITGKDHNDGDKIKTFRVDWIKDASF